MTARDGAADCKRSRQTLPAAAARVLRPPFDVWMAGAYIFRWLALPLLLLPIVGAIELMRAVHRWRKRWFDEWELRESRHNM